MVWYNHSKIITHMTLYTCLTHTIKSNIVHFVKYQLIVSQLSLSVDHIPMIQTFARRVWRYQRGNQNPYIEEEQITQWAKEEVQKEKQRSTKHTYQIKDRVTWTPVKSGVSNYIYTILYLYVIQFNNYEPPWPVLQKVKREKCYTFISN